MTRSRAMQRGDRIAKRGTAKKRGKSAQYAERGLEHFRAQLRANALRPSRSRDDLVRCVLRQTGPFCVQDLVREMFSARARGSHFATVYRNMPLLVEAGLVRHTWSGPLDGQRYEVTFERQRPPHLYCLSCESVVEIRAPALEALRGEIAGSFGFELEPGTVQLRGQCRSCK